ncbi:hypothetical protein K353_06614, partial [Kitasatospora sp. SolWspMP-SS2h]
MSRPEKGRGTSCRTRRAAPAADPAEPRSPEPSLLAERVTGVTTERPWSTRPPGTAETPHFTDFT